MKYPGADPLEGVKVLTDREHPPLKTLPVLRAVGAINREREEAAELPMIRKRVSMRASLLDASITACLERGWLVHDDMLTGYWLTELGNAQLPSNPDNRMGFRGVPR